MSSGAGEGDESEDIVEDVVDDSAGLWTIHVSGSVGRPMHCTKFDGLNYVINSFS